MRMLTNRRARNRGYLMITVTTFIAVISVLLAGVSTYAASHRTIAEKDADWTRALDIAEAGINTELSKISRNPTTADQYPGTTYSFGGGSYKVWVVRRNHNGTESTPWTAPNDMYVYSQGTFDGTMRTVKVSVKANLINNRYALFGINSVDVQGNANINGLVGTNGVIQQQGNSVTLSPGIELCGPGAAAVNLTGVPQTTQSQPRYWQTVDEIAWDLFPQGGMDWVRTHNDNSRVGLPSSGDVAQINNSITLIGPGNYYVRSITLTGSARITFNNTAGPIRLFIGRTSYTGQSTFAGSTSAVPTGTNQVDIYCAAVGGVELVGNAAVRCNIYAYNLDSAGNPYGLASVRGNPVIYGSVIGWNASLRGNVGTELNDTFVNPVGEVGYYGFDNSWSEGSMENGSFTAEGRN